MKLFCALQIVMASLILQACNQGRASNPDVAQTPQANRDENISKVEPSPNPSASSSDEEDAPIDLATLKMCYQDQYNKRQCDDEIFVSDGSATNEHAELQPVHALFIPRDLPESLDFEVILPEGRKLSTVKHASVDLQSDNIHVLGFASDDVVVSTTFGLETLFVHVTNLSNPLQIAREHTSTLRILFWDEVVPFDQTPLEIVVPLYFQE